MNIKNIIKVKNKKVYIFWIVAVLLVTCLVWSINKQNYYKKQYFRAVGKNRDLNYKIVEVDNSTNKLQEKQKEIDGLASNLFSAEERIEYLEQQLDNGIVYKGVIIDKSMSREVVDVILRHYKALSNGDLDAYKSTIISNNEYLIDRFNRLKDTNFNIVRINCDEISESGSWVDVILDVESNSYCPGVMKVNGKWLICDFD